MQDAGAAAEPAVPGLVLAGAHELDGDCPNGAVGRRDGQPCGSPAAAVRSVFADRLHRAARALPRGVLSGHLCAAGPSFRRSEEVGTRLASLRRHAIPR